MKHLHFLTLAIAALALTMTGCNGNDPDQPALLINLQVLSTQAHVTVMAADNETFFLTNPVSKAKLEQVGSLQTYVEQQLSARSYEEAVANAYFSKTLEEYNTPIYHPSTDYVVYACYVVPDEQGNARISGRIVSREFTTLPQYLLPGAFSVSPTKQVCFAEGNVVYQDGAYSCFTEQYNYACASSGNKIDMFQWDKIAEATAQLSDFYVLSRDEWLYLLKERPRADELFAHATVNNTHGVILLPDNWHTPVGVSLKTSKAMGIVWNNSTYGYEASSEDYDGFAQNKLSLYQWSLLEFAGAVFLPAAGHNATFVGKYGKYWASTLREDIEDSAHSIGFKQSDLSLYLLWGSASKNYYFTFRLVHPL